jgi:hypothetical protein
MLQGLRVQAAASLPSDAYLCLLAYVRGGLDDTDHEGCDAVVRLRLHLLGT